MSLFAKAKKISAFLPGLVVLCLYAALGINEFWSVGIEADPKTISDYHFGSEAMVGVGGEMYRSPRVYAASSFVTFFIASLGLVTSLLFLFRAENRPILKAYFVATSAIGLIFLVGELW